MAGWEQEQLYPFENLQESCDAPELRVYQVAIFIILNSTNRAIRMTGDTVTEDSFVAIASCPVRQRAIVTN